MFKLFIGNLSFHTSADRLRQVFSKFGEVTEVFLGTDPNSGRSRGFGFISMGTQDSGLAAIAALDGKDLEGRTIVVNAAEKRTKPTAKSAESRASGKGGASGGAKKTAAKSPPNAALPPHGFEGHHDSTRQWDHGRDRDRAHDEKREQRFDREP